MVIATATAEANGQHVGDISIILPEGLSRALTKSMTTAIDACGALAAVKLRRDIEGREISRRQLVEDSKNNLMCDPCGS